MAQNEIPMIGVDITRRFFSAVDLLISKKEIRGLGTLARKWNTSRFVLSTTRGYPEKKRLNTELLHYLVRDYNVSPDWLLLGKGDVFSK